jgi:hypothetical protein
MSSTSEKETENRHGIGQHADPNHGPIGLNTGQRTIVRNPASKTALDVDEANGRGVNGSADDRK